jgi:8-oxo-dGTP pyrophosphatase MutT (NUDIX family)
VIVEDDRVALIERHRDGLHYYVVPGGGVEPGETFEQAAIREASEELGVGVQLGPIALDVDFGGRQVYFEARIIRGTLSETPFDELKQRGTYVPRWVPLADLPHIDVRPPEIRDWISPRSRS